MNFDLVIRKKKSLKMVLGKKWVLMKNFVGEPKPEDLSLQDMELPPLKDGGESMPQIILALRSIWACTLDHVIIKSSALN